ncbi:MAG: Hint domain-containing protein [Planctomycetota bacterium]|jgi:hypothetical protein
MLLGETPEDYDKHFILTADIDLDPNLPGRRVFDSAVIGSLSGVFDGNDYTISHLTVTGDRNPGLFGRVGYEATVKDVGVVDIRITAAGFGGVGGVVGENRGYVIQCYSSGTITGVYDVGGLVSNNMGAVIDCYSTCSVTGDSGIGGLVGANNGAVFNCYSACSVTGSYYVGGLVGLSVGNMINCYSTGGVVGNYAVGGLVGRNGHCLMAAASPGYIDRSYSFASVSGESFVGGLVGENFAGDLTQCYSQGAVNGDSYVGGLAGDNMGYVTQCYSTGAVIGDGNDVGGLVGRGWWRSDVSPSFWDIQTSGQATSAGGTGLATSDMQAAGTFLDAGWNFIDETANGTEDIWWILEDQDYPRLYWEWVGNDGSRTGAVLGKASEPYPSDGAADVEETWRERFFKLVWSAGLGAVAHNVHFGTDLGVVSQSDADGVHCALIFRNLVATELRLWPLERDKTYYWRIDGVGGDGTILTGDVWSFTTALQPSWWKGRACFTGDTLVWIGGNLIPISSAVPGQVIRCGDDQNDVEEVQVHNGVFTCYDIVLETGNCIAVAECHYFMTISGRWVALHNVKAGTRLKTSKGDVGVTSLRKRPRPYAGRVFNLKMKGSDRYLVGKDTVVVRDY